MSGILAGPIDGPDRLARQYPAVEATTGLAVVHRASGLFGQVQQVDTTHVTLRTATGLERRFPNQPGAFLVNAAPVRLVAPAVSAASAATAADAPPSHLAGARVTDERTASGSRAVKGAKARVARASRILVEGVHDAELVERVWGDDLRIEGIVVERLDGIDHLDAALAQLQPSPECRIGVLVDHLVPNSKEARIAESIRNPHVCITGTPYIDVWEAVRPRALGIAAWPVIPKGQDWKTGVCQALGVEHPATMWRTILCSVTSWVDLEAPFVGAVETLIDFVTASDTNAMA